MYVRHNSADSRFQFKYPLPCLAACLMAMLFCLVAWTVHFEVNMFATLCVKQKEFICYLCSIPLYPKIINSIFCWPCIVVYPCNTNQQDALFSI